MLTTLKDLEKAKIFSMPVENLLCENNSDLEILYRISSHSTSAMTGKEKGVIKLLINKIESNNKTHNCCKKDDLFIIYYLIYHQNRCVQILSMNHFIQVVIKTVIRTRVLPH